MKMATGSGKTVVMGMLIAWHALNKLEDKHDRRFSDAFLIVAPGITIRDRLRVLLPQDPSNYYRERDLVPSDLVERLGQARIVITNFHAFLLHERGDAARVTKAILTRGAPSPFIETPDQMVRRVCREMGGKKQIIVLNDEAHHCYRGKPRGDGEALTGDDRVEAKRREEEARVWMSGLESVHRKLGVRAVYDLSATPFFLRGSGYDDPTCGSGTAAVVAEELGRRWITCDTSRVALTLARTRLMSARYPWFQLADSPEGQQKEAEVTGKIPPAFKTENDVKKGFVYKRVPHVTLKSIANNPDIREGMTRQEIDAAILRHADTELLYDKPYEDGRRIRVTGPFTVESLSPHRVLPADDERPKSEQEAQRDASTGQFETMILDNLRKAGVQNTVKNERLVFDRLEPLAGSWLQASGTYADADGKSRRVAISIGPEHGTVGPTQVKEAAKEAVLGVGYDVLVVCGFAFDPHVSEEAKRYGKLQVLTARMNPDLSMGDELLKKTGAGNLFMVFGEPDVEISPVDTDGNLRVTLRGVDVYDPTTGAIRSHSTDDIACWFIDTNYDGEGFFVRHAYFTGADEPYDKLKRALRADIDEGAWATLYSTVSRPFAPPETGKIAVKVINHYGDEVLKVFEV